MRTTTVRSSLYLQLQQWQTTFQLLKYAGANLAALGLTAADLTPITAAQSAWTAAYSDHVAGQVAAKAASQTKDFARDSYEAFLRKLAQRIQTKPDLADGHRAALQITVRETQRTPAGVPETRPVVNVNTIRGFGIRSISTMRRFLRGEPSLKA